MNAVINLGSPLKDLSAIATAALGRWEQSALKITGAKLFRAPGLALTSPLYDAGMVLDCLEEMWLQKLLGSRSRFVLVGSMGSLADGIALRDIVIPNPALCAYYGFAGREIWQDAPMRESLLSALQSGGYKPKQYRHGSSYAVFDPHTDHKTYTTSLYDKTVTGVDCSEVFIGLEFAARKGIRVAAALYCSDTPAHHISDVGELEFERTARENDLLLNRVSADLLAETRGQT